MKRVFFGMIIILVLEAFALLVCVYLGGYNISTYNHDNGVINWALDHGMTRAVQTHARGIQPPSELSDTNLVQRGFREYNEMCVQCHGAPGVEPGEIGKGLWPAAPDLTKTVPDWTVAELYWITRNGIKFSAMPAWGPTHDEKALWSMVAFMRQLPYLSPDAYNQMRSHQEHDADHESHEENNSNQNHHH